MMFVRLCVCLSIPSIDRSSGVRRVCCWAPGGQEISIDSGGRPAARRRSTEPQQQMRPVSRLRPPQQAEV